MHKNKNKNNKNNNKNNTKKHISHLPEVSLANPLLHQPDHQCCFPRLHGHRIAHVRATTNGCVRCRTSRSKCVRTTKTWQQTTLGQYRTSHSTRVGPQVPCALRYALRGGPELHHTLSQYRASRSTRPQHPTLGQYRTSHSPA
eukprot:2155705-Rhodomonas_salina.2